MFKKLIILFFVCVTVAFSKQQTGSLTVTPISPLGWKFDGADLYVNDQLYRKIGINVVTIPVTVNDQIRLQIYTYEGHYAMDDSCLHIRIQDEANHKLGFVLDNDWKIHCYYLNEALIL